MSDKINVDYKILDGCITNFKLITEAVGGDEIRKMIASLDNVFGGTNSEFANALVEKKKEYSIINNMLINISINMIGVLERAKEMYEDADLSMKTLIEERYANNI